MVISFPPQAYSVSVPNLLYRRRINSQATRQRRANKLLVAMGNHSYVLYIGLATHRLVWQANSPPLVHFLRRLTTRTNRSSHYLGVVPSSQSLHLRPLALLLSLLPPLRSQTLSRTSHFSLLHLFPVLLSPSAFHHLPHFPSCTLPRRLETDICLAIVR